MKELSVKEKNEISLQRLWLTDEYVKTEYQLELLLNQYRLYLSKTKAIVGFSKVNATMIDNREVEESVRIEFNDATKKYGVCELENKNAYHPFGLLEPTTAKQARSTMASVLLVVCELASIKRKLEDLSI
ncbi:hypothetical protein M3Y98_00527000 [Aphelenchoides besseyi]|nr:hypothetical protein M3Y98_00527000 [Aphelenchoides besseyi]KAI6208003.1 hypothetical protein M3Y96_00068600 [Aphelenchoides besseyi]